MERAEPARVTEPACGCSAKGGALKSAAFSRTHSRAARGDAEGGAPGGQGCPAGNHHVRAGLRVASGGWPADPTAAVCSLGALGVLCSRHYALQSTGGVHLHLLACRCKAIATRCPPIAHAIIS